MLTDDLDDAEAEPDGGVGEGHDGGEDGEPGDLVEVRDLREEDLGHAEDDHVGRAGDGAGVAVPLLVEAVGSPDGAARRARTRHHVTHHSFTVQIIRKEPNDRGKQSHSQHADGGGDGVPDGHPDDVGVLQEPADLDLDATCGSTKLIDPVRRWTENIISMQLMI